MALFADLTGVTPDPLGCICTSPLKRVFRYVLFGQNKAAKAAMPDPRGQSGLLPGKKNPHWELSSERNDLDFKSFEVKLHLFCVPCIDINLYHILLPTILHLRKHGIFHSGCSTRLYTYFSPINTFFSQHFPQCSIYKFTFFTLTKTSGLEVN